MEVAEVPVEEKGDEGARRGLVDPASEVWTRGILDMSCVISVLEILHVVRQHVVPG